MNKEQFKKEYSKFRYIVSYEDNDEQYSCYVKTANEDDLFLLGAIKDSYIKSGDILEINIHERLRRYKKRKRFNCLRGYKELLHYKQLPEFKDYKGGKL